MLDVNVIRKAGMEFDVGLSLGEDTKFINEYLLNSTSVGILEETLYYLTVREGSANMVSQRDPVLMAQNKTRLIEARKQIERLAQKKGVNIREYWQGTMVLSGVQLALRLSTNKALRNDENRQIYFEYISQADVRKAVSEFVPAFGVKAVPFLLMKYGYAGLLYNLCRLIPAKLAGRIV